MLLQIFKLYGAPTVFHNKHLNIEYPYINIKVFIQLYSFSRVQDYAVVYKMPMCECEALCVVSGHHEAALTIESSGPISEVCFIAGRGA